MYVISKETRIVLMKYANLSNILLCVYVALDLDNRRVKNYHCTILLRCPPLM